MKKVMVEFLKLILAILQLIITVAWLVVLCIAPFGLLKWFGYLILL